MTGRSIATVSLSGALDEKLRAIAAAGFDAVEIFENDLLSFNGSPQDVGQLCRDLGLTICAFQPFRDFEGMPEPQRARNFARAERKFDVMLELQTDLPRRPLFDRHHSRQLPCAGAVVSDHRHSIDSGRKDISGSIG